MELGKGRRVRNKSLREGGGGDVARNTLAAEGGRGAKCKGADGEGDKVGIQREI
jgi:hypothetical protein